MEKVLRYCLCFIITICSCKPEPQNKFKTEPQNKFEKNNLNCLKKRDLKAIEIFKNNFARAILKKDKIAMMDFINSPELLNDYYEGITEYCIKSTIADYYEISNEEYFSEKEGTENCFVFGISNSFPDLEINYVFIFDKVNGEIKLVKVELMG